MPITRDNLLVTSEKIKIEELIKIGKGKKIYSGAISNEIKEKLDKESIEYVDMLERDDVAIMNAIPTAEGAIQIAMEMTDFTLHESNCMILGYGNIGKVLAKMLSGIGANVFCEARKEKDLANIKTMRYNCIRLEDLSKHLENMDVIFNTIPFVILVKKNLIKKKKDGILMN